MGLFKKDKTHEEQKTLEVKASNNQGAAPGFLPDSKDLAQSKQHAEEQIRNLEAKIQSQRELWSVKFKEKEEEKISLSAQFEMLTRKARTERDKSESELNFLEQQIQGDLVEAQKTLEAEIKTWSERLNIKDKEIEQTKQEIELQETRKKIESDQNVRGLKSELDQIEQKYKSLERKKLEEQNAWIGKIRSKEEEILGIKTQISLKESQVSIDDEKDLMLKKEKEAAWQSQVQELETKLKNQSIELAKEHKRKQEELLALKAALETRLSAISIEADKKEKDTLGLIDRTEERIKFINGHIIEESKNWQAALKERDEEFNKLKVELMLRESQEKTERENKFQELRDSENLANRKIKEIRQKINDEKENWKTSLDAKEEELKLFKIQAELKLKEIQGMWEKRKTRAQEEKTSLENKLTAMKGMFEQEKLRLKKELDEKTSEIETYKQKWQQQQGETAASNEKTLEELKIRKESLEKELSSLEENLNVEKAKWEELLLQKERESGAVRNEQSNKQSSALRELEIIEMQLKKEQQPLADKLRETEKRFEEFRKLSQAEFERKESAKAALQEQYRSREESILRRYGAQAQKFKAAEEEIVKSITAVKVSIEQQSAIALKRVEELKKEENDIRGSLASQDRRMEAEKKKLAEEYKNRKELLEESARNVEREHAQYREKLITELDEKSREAEEIRTSLQEKEKELQKELRQKEEEQAAQKARSETELAALNEVLRKNSEDYERGVKAHRFTVETLEKSFKEKEMQFQGELRAIKAEWERNLQPLSDSKKHLETRIAVSKKETDDKFTTIENGLKVTKELYKTHEDNYIARMAEEDSKLISAKEKFTKDIASLNLQIETQSKQSKEVLERLTQKEKSLENSMSIEEQKLNAERQRVTHYYESQQKQLAETVNSLEKDYLEYVKNIDAEIKQRNQELAQEEINLRNIEEENRKEFKQKEQQLAAVENENRKQITFLSSEYEKTKNDFNHKIKTQEDSLNSLAKTMQENKISYEREIGTLKENLLKELDPFYKRKTELKADYEREKNEAEEKLAAAAKRIEILKAEQSLKSTEYLQLHTAQSSKLDSAKMEFDKQVKILLDKRDQIEKEYLDATAAKETEIKALEAEALQGKNAFEKQKDELIAQDILIAAKLKEEIEGLEKDTARLQKEYPQVLLEREKEISLLSARIEQKALDNRDKLDQAEKSAENYQRRAERRITQLKSQIAETQDNHKKELEAAELKLGNIRSEIAKKESEYQAELLKEGKIFAEQKYSLEKRKSELEEKTKDAHLHSREEIRQKEKELLILQTELAEKEKAWEESWKQKEQELAVEKNSLVWELESLDARLKNEEETANKRISEKEREMQSLENTYYTKLDNMTAEIASKKSAWEQTNAALKSQAEELKNSLGAFEHGWEETKAQKDKELTVLKSNLEFWELRSKSEEEKRLAAWEEEKSEQEARIKDAEFKLAALKKDQSIKYEEKEKALNELKTRSEENEKQKAAELKSLEDNFTAAKDALAFEITSWEKKLKDETVRTEKEKKDIEREIEKLKIESALKENAASSEQQKNERKWRKLQRELEDQLADFERQFVDEKENLTSRLNIKTEEISTLKVRMSLRDERRQSEMKHRHEEIEKVIAGLDSELKSLEAKYGKDSGSIAEGIQKSKTELDALKNEAMQKEEKWQKEREERENAANGAYAAILKDLEDVENELKKESKRLAQLLDVKEKQIANLTQQMQSKEENLVIERDFSQAVLQNLQKKSAELQRALNFIQRTGKESEKENTTQLFGKAVELYNSADYPGAIEALNGILKANPDFAGAYQYLALCSWNLGEKEKSKQLARRALELEPHNEELKLWIEYMEKEDNK